MQWQADRDSPALVPPGAFPRSDDVRHATLALARRLLIAPMTSIPATAHHAMKVARPSTGPRLLSAITANATFGPQRQKV